MTGRERVSKYFTPMQLLQEFDLEADIQTMARTLFRVYGSRSYAIRNAFAVTRGTSDLIICFEGFFIVCELKSKTGTPTELQLKFVEDVKAAGGFAAVCSCLADILDLLDAALLRLAQ